MNDPTDAPTRYDFEAIARSFTGFDEIAIERTFKMSFRKLGSGTMAARAALFIQWRREGTKDADAYKRAMLIPLSELEDMFEDEADDDGMEDEDDPKAGNDSE